jgi:hypothetical protein
VRPGGVVVLVPDTTRELFTPSTRHGGHDGEGGRSLRYLEWTYDSEPEDTTYEVDFAILLREPGRPVRMVQDHHTFGLFADATWRRLTAESGLELLDLVVDDPYAGEHAVYVARRPL